MILDPGFLAAVTILCSLFGGIGCLHPRGIA